MDTNFKGSIAAISAVVVMVIAKFGFNVGAGDVATVIFGVVALVGIIKQMIDHKNVVATGNAIIAGKRV